MNTDHLEPTEPSPPLIAPRDKWAWYVWEKWRDEPHEAWHRTCWDADSEDAAIKLRGSVMYHTQFHSGKPQKLVRERMIFTPCEDVVETRVGSYGKWTNGIPNTFGWIGVGFGYRLSWTKAKCAWVKGFEDEHTAIIGYHGFTESWEGRMSLDEFVANMPAKEEPA